MGNEHSGTKRVMTSQLVSCAAVQSSKFECSSVCEHRGARTTHDHIPSTPIVFPTVHIPLPLRMWSACGITVDDPSRRSDEAQPARPQDGERGDGWRCHERTPPPVAR
jgi:hypothetical protein